MKKVIGLGRLFSEFSVSEAIDYIVRLRFKHYVPSCRTWYAGFVKENKKATLCILFRKNGIDFRLFGPGGEGIRIDENYRLCLSGGELFRNHFNRSSSFLLFKAMYVARDFVQGIVSERIWVEDGESYLECPGRSEIRRKSLEIFLERKQRLIEDKEYRWVSGYISQSRRGF